MGYAIVTRYHGPTNYRGSRVTGTGPAITHDVPKTRATVAWHYGLSNGTSMSETEANHRAAADAVAEKLRAAGWHVTIGRSATLPDEDGYVFLPEYGSEPTKRQRAAALLTEAQIDGMLDAAA